MTSPSLFSMTGSGNSSYRGTVPTVCRTAACMRVPFSSFHPGILRRNMPLCFAYGHELLSALRELCPQLNSDASTLQPLTYYHCQSHGAVSDLVPKVFPLEDSVELRHRCQAPAFLP